MRHLKKINFLLFSAVIFLFAACNTTEHLINSGNYEQAIARSVNKLQRNKTKSKQIDLLKQSYDKAQQKDIDRINFLKKEGQASNAVEVFNIYQNIKNRQNKIKPLLPLYIDNREVPFELINVDNEIIKWKQEAAGYLYQSAIKLLSANDKYKAREAFDELTQVKQIYPNYMDVDKKLQQAQNMGMNWVKYDIVNRSPNIIPVEFVNELNNLDYISLQGKWFTLVSSAENQQINFDETVRLTIDIVDVGSEKTNQKEWTETKDIISKYVDAKDKNGHYILDSTGNRIQTPIYKEISCTVHETHQFKSATFKGKIAIYENKSNQLLRSEPININFVFDHTSYVPIGNNNALKSETKKLIGSKPVPYPSDFQMIMDGSSEVKPVIDNFIRRNKDILEQ